MIYFLKNRFLCWRDVHSNYSPQVSMKSIYTTVNHKTLLLLFEFHVRHMEQHTHTHIPSIRM